MRILLRALLPVVVAVAISREGAAQPNTGSQLDIEENLCAACHGESDLWEEDTRRLHISKESLAHDIHFRKGVNCHDCHGGDPSSFDVREAHATVIDGEQSQDRGVRFPLEGTWKSCLKCHEDAASGDLTLDVEDTISGEILHETFDMVVLATGVVPNTAELKIPFGLNFDAYGFIDGTTDLDGIYPAGCVKRPCDVSRTTKDSTAAAMKAIQNLKRGV